MTRWIKTDDGLEATINGHNYLIAKSRNAYIVYCDEVYIAGSECGAILDAKQLVQEMAETAGPAPAKLGVHIDNIAGQQLVDIMKRSFTTAQIQDFIDASPYDEPDTGAPEAGA